jgi:lysophospholipase L1-like esterase
MGEDQRKQWLDDGLHFTEHGYDQLASHIANAITTNFATTR